MLAILIAQAPALIYSHVRIHLFQSHNQNLMPGHAGPPVAVHPQLYTLRIVTHITHTPPSHPPLHNYLYTQFYSQMTAQIIHKLLTNYSQVVNKFIHKLSINLFINLSTTLLSWITVNQFKYIYMITDFIQRNYAHKLTTRLNVVERKLVSKVGINFCSMGIPKVGPNF